MEDAMDTYQKRVFSSGVVLFMAMMMVMAGCGGGGGGASAPAQAVVSGTVQAPNAQIAFFPRHSLPERLASWFISSANAALSGIASVPNGTPVELDRMGDDGSIKATISRTATAGGRFSFNLTQLGSAMTSDLIVRVANPGSGVQMRAFVTGDTVDINPTSEACVRLVLARLATPPASTLAAFTSRELADLAASVDLLTTARQMTAGGTVEATVTAIEAASTADAGISAFLASAAAAGQTASGPGDVGNYFPVSVGNKYTYQGVVTASGGSPLSFNDDVTISGTTVVNGAVVTVFSQTNADGSGQALDNYYLKESTGVMNYGDNDPSDTVTARIVPYPEIRFPLAAGASFVQVDRGGLDYGSDLDGDGKNEHFNIRSVVKVAGFESVTTPAGTMAACARIETTATLTLIASSNGAQVTATGIQTNWFAPGVGIIKTMSSVTVAGQTQTETLDLSGFLGSNGALGHAAARQGPLAAKDLHSSTGPGKLLASLAGRAGAALGTAAR